MRIAYFDEAGVSSKAHEPHLVVAGVIVNPDEQYHAIEAHIRALGLRVLKEKAKPYYGKPYVFHAKDVWHGSGDFSRVDWSRDDRMKLLELLCRIPVEFNLPVIFGAVPKEAPGVTLPNLHTQAYVLAIKRLESWMSVNADKEVVATVSERCDKEHMAHIASFHHVIVDKTLSALQPLPNHFVSKHIVEAPIFLDKYSSPLLQLADVCAFVMKRKLQKCRHIGPYFELIQKAIWYQPKKGDRILMMPKVADLLDANTGKAYRPRTPHTLVSLDLSPTAKPLNRPAPPPGGGRRK